jgi:L-iditol 2-dehydrogenase
MRPIFPTIGGHELAGTVHAVNDPRSDLAPGMRVVVDAARRCGRCDYCLKGADHLCAEMREKRRPGGFVRIGGGFAEYTVVPSAMALRLADHVGFEEASLIEPLACCLHSVRKAGLNADETAVVFGAGTMGSMHVMLGKLRSARVFACDPDGARRAFAEHLGADEVLDPRTVDLIEFTKEHTAGRGADVVFVTAGSKAAGEQALALVAPLGRVVFYASTQPPLSLELDWNRLHYSESIVTGSRGKTAADFREAAALLESKQVDLRPFVSRVIRLEELPGELACTPAGSTQRVIVSHDHVSRM